MCVYAINLRIAQYFHFVVFRDLFEYVPLKEHSFYQVVTNMTVLKKKGEGSHTDQRMSSSSASLRNIDSSVVRLKKK
jgi:hypothetical protein